VKAQLAMTTIDGAVRLVDIVQSWPLESSSVTVTLEQVRMLDEGDKRSIAAVHWVDVGCLQGGGPTMELMAEYAGVD
jgi:hypothetical protein